MRYPIHEIWRDTYFDVIEEWRQRYGNGHLEIRKMKIKETLIYHITKQRVCETVSII
jgi:hypothetical protein